MLAQRPLSGYELLGELERQYAPNYRPSPGSVYPALSALRTERLVEPAPSERKGPYRVTTKGRRMLAAQRDVLERIEARTSSSAETIASLQPSLAQFAARINKLSGRLDRAAVERILDAAAKAIADLEVSNGERRAVRSTRTP
ncbi:MAG: helix-turn-helix transcriptional regulator [Acidimicrobiia bacterium]